MLVDDETPKQRTHSRKMSQASSHGFSNMEEIPDEEKEEKGDIFEADNTSTRETETQENNLHKASFAFKIQSNHRYDKSNSATERMSFISQVSDYQDEPKVDSMPSTL